MRSLVDFINSKINESCETCESKNFKFSFKELPNAEETIKSLVDISTDKGLEFEATEDSFEITLNSNICSNNRDKIDAIQDILQQYSDLIRKDSQNASRESFAQFTKSFKNKVEEMVSFIDKANEESEEPEHKEDE